MLAIDQCTQDVVIVPTEADVSEAARVMKRSGVGSLVVVDAVSRPVGILTDRDLCLRAVAPATQRAAPPTAGDLMSAPVETLDHQSTVDEALRRMRTLGVRRMPIVREGTLAGIVALDDLVAVLAKALHDLAVEGLERRRKAQREGRYGHARSELSRLRREVGERMRRARWEAQDTLFQEIDDLRARARELFQMDPGSR